MAILSSALNTPSPSPEVLDQQTDLLEQVKDSLLARISGGPGIGPIDTSIDPPPPVEPLPPPLNPEADQDVLDAEPPPDDPVEDQDTAANEEDTITEASLSTSGCRTNFSTKTRKRLIDAARQRIQKISEMESRPTPASPKMTPAPVYDFATTVHGPSWKLLGDPLLVQWMTKGVRIPMLTLKRSLKRARKTTVCEAHTSFVSALITSAVVAPTSRPVKIFPLFFVPKPDDTLRGIVNLSQLTDKIPTPSFSLPTARKVMAQLSKPGYACKIDLKNGFYHVPLHPKSRMLGFRYDGQDYVFNHLPMGICNAPWIFQRITSTVARYISRNFGIFCRVYLDDFLFWHENKDILAAAMLRIVELFNTLGLRISSSKSILTPQRELEFLGLMLNFETRSVHLSTAKTALALSCVDLLQTQLSIRDAQSIVGYLTFCVSTMPFGLSWTRPLTTIIQDALQSHHKQVVLGRAYPITSLKQILQQTWSFPNSTDFNAMGSISCDAAGAEATGNIGLVHKGTPLTIIQSSNEQIFFKEMRAAFIAMVFHDQVLTDNQGVFFTIRKGSSKFKWINDMFQRWSCLFMNFGKREHRVQWVPSAENPADDPSRDDRWHPTATRSFLESFGTNAIVGDF